MQSRLQGIDTGEIERQDDWCHVIVINNQWRHYGTTLGNTREAMSPIGRVFRRPEWDIWDGQEGGRPNPSMSISAFMEVCRVKLDLSA
jgi:hypothetical protein